ncbi:potassium channel family protein [Peptoclostridium acidaminophilum]|nr:TrkA family potassium uptake protein [Peptoclostridium acidaminophilum]
MEMNFMGKNGINDEYVIIVGCGRLGAHLANALFESGKSVVIIDMKPSAFRRLVEGFGGFALEADATELDTLKKAGIENADVFAAITDDDNTNIMLAQIAKTIYGVRKVIARVYEPNRQNVYEELEIKTICPMTLSAEAFKDSIENDEGGD